MAAPDYRIISIGALAAHPLWNERGDVRAPHATTTLISVEEQHILVDPSLPPNLLLPRLAERTDVKPEAITQVFLTSFEPLRRRGLSAFPNAKWFISEREREAIGVSMVRALHEAREAGDDELITMLTHEVALLERCRPAPDSLASSVDLFPLPGVTPGLTGLLLALPNLTVLLCGDAVPTSEHLRDGKVLPHCVDVQQARESFSEAIEIADVLILGRDNLAVNPLRKF